MPGMGKLKLRHLRTKEKEIVESKKPAFSLHEPTCDVFHFKKDLVSPLRKVAAHYLHSDAVQFVIGSLIVVNSILVIYETDAHAAGEDMPSWMQVVDKMILVVFVLELTARLFASRLSFFQESFNLLDLFVVVCDVVLESLTYAGMDGSLDATVFLRILRILRLTRAHRLILMLPKLALMARSLVGAMEAIVWGCSLLFLVMTLWSIFTVQLVHPLVLELVEEHNMFADCERCRRAFSSVMDANLTYFQQIIAGDSWGLVTIPIMEHYPWTALLFIPVFLTMSVAIMNVILAVIVESAEETRQDDLRERLKIREKLFVSKSLQLLKVCEALDEDESGDLTFEELMKGFDENRELAMTLHDMGLERDDLQTIYQIMDDDNSGNVDYHEFVHHIHKMRTADEHTTLDFIRHYVLQILRAVKQPGEYTQKLSQQYAAMSNVKKNAVDGAENITNEDMLAFDVKEGAVNDVYPPTINGADMKEFQDVCNQVMDRLHQDLSANLAEISRKCEVQMSMLTDLSKRLPSSARQGCMASQLAVVPNGRSREELMSAPKDLTKLPPAYACMLSNCTVETVDRRSGKLQAEAQHASRT